MERKTCNRCKEDKPTSEFHKYSRSKDGYKSECKQCRNDLSKEYRKKVPQKPMIRKYIYVMCEDCSVIIKRRTDQLQEENRCQVCANRKASHERIGKPIPSMWTGRHLNCDYCGKETYKPGSQIHTHNFCSRPCYEKWQKENFNNSNFIKSADNSGANNGRYKHGQRIGGHDRHKDLKKMIVQRDGEGCLLCKAKENLHVHRIIPGALKGQYVLPNTVILCKKHHGTVHQEYDLWKTKLLNFIKGKSA